MHVYVYQFLRSFRNIFSRQSTWLVFCMVILGFIGSGEMVGVTSFWPVLGGRGKRLSQLSQFLSLILPGLLKC